MDKSEINGGKNSGVQDVWIILVRIKSMVFNYILCNAKRVKVKIV